MNFVIFVKLVSSIYMQRCPQIDSAGIFAVINQMSVIISIVIFVIVVTVINVVFVILLIIIELLAH